MLPKHLSLTAVLFLSLGLLGGCSDVTMHEPGVYKGSGDNAASEEAAANRAQPLEERANRAFTDR